MVLVLVLVVMVTLAEEKYIKTSTLHISPLTKEKKKEIYKERKREKFSPADRGQRKSPPGRLWGAVGGLVGA